MTQPDNVSLWLLAIKPRKQQHEPTTFCFQFSKRPPLSMHGYFDKRVTSLYTLDAYIQQQWTQNTDIKQGVQLNPTESWQKVENTAN